MGSTAKLPQAFWIFWSALTATNVSDGIRLVAFPLLATSLTQNPTLIALVTVFTYLPALLFGQIAGVIVDRVPKRPLIVASHIARAVILMVVAVVVAIGILDIAMLCVAAFLYGVGEAASDPAAHAMLPEIVSASDLSRANSDLQSGQIIGEMFIGRARGGILFAVAQPLPVAVNTLLLVAAAAAMLSLGKEQTPPAEKEGDHAAKPAARRIRDFRNDLVDGIRVVTQSRLLGAMSLLVTVWAGVSGAFWGVAAIFALRDLESGEVGFGILLALAAVGSLVGARIAIPVIRAFGAPGVAVTAVLVSAVSIIALSGTHELWLASLLLAANGAAVTLWNVMTITIRQVAVEPNMLGRVSSTYLVLARMSLPVGAGLAGALASATDVPTVFIVFGSLLVLASTVLLPLLWRELGRIWPRGQTSAKQAGSGI